MWQNVHITTSDNQNNVKNPPYYKAIYVVKVNRKVVCIKADVQ